MTLDVTTRAIIRLAWCRRLGLADDALETEPSDPGGGSRIEIERSDGEVGLVAVFTTTVLLGPARLLSAAREVSDDDLSQAPGHASAWPDLLNRSGLTGLRLAGPEVLCYLDDYQPVAGSPLVSDEVAAASALAERCPPDDRIGVELSDLAARFVLLDEDDHQRPVAGAGYAEAGGLLGRLQVLTARSRRRRRLGTTAARIAANDALDAGLVVEGVVPVGNTAALALSESAGFSRVGCRIWSA